MKKDADALLYVIYIAGNARQSAAAEELLSNEGFYVRVREMGDSGTTELMVLKSEAEEARRFLSENGF